eukprot:CAMPEP_0172153754 /NCGR_PEP_ID=MMETSP1050-20130122/1637_1 /TAXON_ID=233186 /ORGANISM="Cryptomonas curvata, Strain CCAP979/52" /LENGTH=148 /DNA_ID=CAMNT_0012822359 /DNA_START=51 /DNA_END=494 /DNA_ORIENTATION=-
MTEFDGQMSSPPPQYLKQTYEVAKQSWVSGKKRFSLFQIVAAKVENAAAFGASVIGFESLPQVESWLSQKVESADVIAAPYLAKSAPLVISAYDRCCKITSNPKTLEALEFTLRPIMPVLNLAGSLVPIQTTAFFFRTGVQVAALPLS